MTLILIIGTIFTAWAVLTLLGGERQRNLVDLTMRIEHAKASAQAQPEEPMVLHPVGEQPPAGAARNSR